MYSWYYTQSKTQLPFPILRVRELFPIYIYTCSVLVLRDKAPDPISSIASTRRDRQGFLPWKTTRRRCCLPVSCTSHPSNTGSTPDPHTQSIYMQLSWRAQTIYTISQSTTNRTPAHDMTANRRLWCVNHLCRRGSKVPPGWQGSGDGYSAQRFIEQAMPGRETSRSRAAFSHRMPILLALCNIPVGGARWGRCRPGHHVKTPPIRTRCEYNNTIVGLGVFDGSRPQ